jgi:hypothetical protein
MHWTSWWNWRHVERAPSAGHGLSRDIDNVTLVFGDVPNIFVMVCHIEMVSIVEWKESDV